MSLLISSKAAAKLIGIAPRSVESVLTAMGIKPVLATGTEKRRLRWSRPEILRAVSTWSSRANVAVIDAGRSRAPRQAAMREIISRA